MKHSLLALGCSFLTMLAPFASSAHVGMRQIGSEELPITVLYPTEQTPQVFSQGAIQIEVAPDADPMPGTHPVLVLSHGSGGSAIVDHQLAATLVEAGFVVVQPQHQGDNYRDYSQAGPVSWHTRPTEISRAIDAVAKDPALSPHIRTDRVGVHGMSAGGATALVMAGGQWSMLELLQHCGQNLQADIGFCMNGLGQRRAQQWLRRAQFMMSGLTPPAWLPKELHQIHGGKTDPDPRPDPRVAAVSLLVPLGAIFTAESLARINIPVGITVAEADEVVVPQFHSGHILTHCTTCTVLSSHPKAGHFDWLAPWPPDLAKAVAAVQMRGGLPNPEFGRHEQQAAFDRIAEFFKQHF